MYRAPRELVIVATFAAAAMCISGVANASPVRPMRARLPAPGSPSQVLALVAASDKIEKLPKTLVPSLQNAAYDNASNYYPVIKDECSTSTQCVFGDKSSPTTVALFGDSHAAMWLPPLIYDADALKFRVVLFWFSSCPAATVSVWDASQHEVNEACNSWRTQSLADVEKLSPSLVLLTDRTSAIKGVGGKAIASVTWRSGMEKTISELQAAELKVGLIGDITALTDPMPACLAAHPAKIQDCSSPNPNPGYKTHVADEEAAAKAEDVPYLNPQSWVCTKKCSPVVGNLVVYYDSWHLSATYAEYLALLLENSVKPLLPAS